jgi:hypothetical protein
MLAVSARIAAIGKLCEKCDGKCVICDSYVRPTTIVHVCDECNYGSYQGRCVICGAPGASDAFYCKECTQQEKDVSWPDPLPRVGERASCILLTSESSVTLVHAVAMLAARRMSEDH